MEKIALIYLLSFVAYGICFGLLCSWLAAEKGRDHGNWFMMGFLFGLLALLALGFAPSLKVGSSPNSSDRQSSPLPSSTTEQSQSASSVEDVKQCPYCVEMIKLRAKKCRFCGTEFTDDEVEAQIAVHLRKRETDEAAKGESIKQVEKALWLETNKKLARSIEGLRIAIKSQEINQVRELLSLGADPNAVYKIGGSPLEYAVEKGNAPIIIALIEAGAKIPKNANLLHAAARIGSADVLQVLISSGADINERNKLGLTALQIAEKQSPKYDDVISILKKAPICFPCPKCKMTFQVAQEFRGKEGTCRTCNTRIKVPK
jgi:hypothetical protein